MQKTYMYTPELTGIKNKVNASHFTLTTKEGKSYKVPTSTLLKQFSNAVALESPVVSMKSGKQEFDCSILHVAIKLAVAIDCAGAKGAIRTKFRNMVKKGTLREGSIWVLCIDGLLDLVLPDKSNLRILAKLSKGTDVIQTTHVWQAQRLLNFVNKF